MTESKLSGRAATLLLMAALAAAALVFLAWLLGTPRAALPAATEGEPGPDAPALAVERSVASAGERAVERDVATPSAVSQLGPGDAQAIAVPGTLLTLMGRVVDDSGRPVVGATVLFGPANRELPMEDDVQLASVTDAGGAFLIPVDGRASGQLTIRANLYVPFERWIAQLLEPVDVGIIVVRQASRLVGRVIDQDGGGVVDAQLVQFDPLSEELGRDLGREREVLGVTDAAGRFSVRGPSAAGLISLAAMHPQYTLGASQIVVAPGAAVTQGIEIRVQAGAVLRGRVVGLSPEERAHVGEVSVAVTPRDALEDVGEVDEDQSVLRVTIDEDGAFEVGGLQLGEPVALSVWVGARNEHASRLRSEYVLGVASGKSEARPIELRYVVPGRITMKVVGPSGVPLRSVLADSYEATPRGADGRMRESPVVLELEDGALEWEAWTPRGETVEAILAVEGPAVGVWEEEAEFRLGKTRDLGTVTLVPSPVDDLPDGRRTITVRVVDRRGRPCPRERIEYRGPTISNFHCETAICDPHGVAIVKVRADRAKCFRYAMERHRGGPRPDDPLDDPFEALAPWVTIPAGGNAAIEVVRPDLARANVTVMLDGDPLPRACVILERAVDESAREAFERSRARNPIGPRTDGEGTIVFADKLPGEWRAWVYHAGLRMPEAFDFTLASGPNDITLRRVNTVLRGRVVDADGEPLVRAVVRINVAGDHVVRSQHWADPSRSKPLPGGSAETAALRDLRAVHTDEQGLYQLAGVTPDRDVVVSVTTPWHVATHSASMRLKVGETRDVPDLALSASGRVHVILPDGFDGDVWLHPAATEPPVDPGFRGSVYGDRVLDGVPAGSWNITLYGEPAMDLATAEPESATADELFQRSLVVEVEVGQTAVVDVR